MRYFIQFIVLVILIQGTYAESIEANDLNNVAQEERYTELICLLYTSDAADE